MSSRAQSGVTLIVSLVMLIVLTLLVVSAIRFGNINLRIAGNSQTQAEASAAAQVAVERIVLAAAANTINLSSLARQTTPVSTGGISYPVTVERPQCILTQNVDPTTLNPDIKKDRDCFGEQDGDPQEQADGTNTRTQAACKDQQWDISAAVGDGSSGTSVTILQGVSTRVGPEVLCP
jgi:hypothetical protein